MNSGILANLNVQSNITMSSREIADVCQKQHPHVKRDIENLCEQLKIDVSKFGCIYFDALNREQTEYRLDKDMCLCLVSGYNAKLRMAIIKRWQQLENQAPSLPNFNDPVAAARAWADEVEAKQVAIAKLEVARPKIAHYDNVVQRDGLLNATQVAQKVGLSAVALNRVLDELGVYNKAVKRGRVFSQWVIDKGLGVIKQTEQGFSQALFTLRGEAWVIEKLTIEGVI